jgi:hypothetical protein
MALDLPGFLNVQPDGRPLHRYRIDDRGFDELQIELRQGFAERRAASLAPVFVLWASEYYRREFDGGAFSWSFLTDPLDLHVDQAVLRELTARGLRALQRPAPRRSDAGVQYLKTIAAEGGLPVRLLASEGGYRAALVGLVSDIERFGVGCPQDQALAFARRRTDRLPFGYRTEEFAELFVQFAREIVELRARAPDGLDADAVEHWLDTADADWRDALTLRLDGPAARSLFAEAMVVRAGGETAEPLRRQLVRGEDGRWQPMVDVAPVTRFPARLLDGIGSDFRRIRLSPKGPLATACPDLLLSLEREDSSSDWTCTRISGRRTARFPFSLSCALQLVAMADGRMLDEVHLPGGVPIDTEEGLTLWTLAETGEDGKAQRLEHAGSASLRTRDPHVWALVANGADPSLEGNLTGQLDGETPEGRLFRLEGDGRLAVRDWSVRIETGANATERDEITALGPRHPVLRDERGDPVFRGLPDLLYRQAGRAFSTLPPRKRHYRRAGRRGWSRSAPDANFVGVLDVAADDQGNVGARLRLRVVPNETRIEPLPNKSGLRLSGFPLGWTVRIAEGEPGVVDTNGSAEIDLPDSLRLKDRVSFFAAAPDASQTLRWQLALPSQTAFFADTEGTLLDAERGITLHDLRAWRVVPARQGRTDLSLQLLVPGHARSTPRLTLPVATEMPLSSFRRLIEDLLAQGGPDAEVRLRVLSGPEQSPRLVVRRFYAETALSPLGVLPTLPNRQDERPHRWPDLVALDLDLPSHVTKVANEGEAALARALGPGRWFLLPSLDGQPLRPPRPLVVPPTAQGNVDANVSRSRLPAAGKGRTRDERVTAYAGVLATATEDEIRPLETAIDALMAHGSSPGALDQVLALSRCPHVAVRLLLRGDASGLNDRLDLELHGARRWAFVGPEDWGRALSAETEALAAILRAQPTLAEKAEDYAREQIGRRVREILLLRPDLDGHIALGLMRACLAAVTDLADWLGRLPPAFAAPEKFLTEQANMAVSRNGDRELSFPDLRAHVVPTSFERFAEDARGLIEAPLFVAEIAFGRRPTPEAGAAIQLLHAMHVDPGHFDAALPAAMAWHEMRAA